MRIGVLTSVHAPMDTRIYFKEARSLAQAGHDVILVAGAGGQPQGVQYVPLPVPQSRLGRLLMDLKIFRIAVRLRCDVIHVHDPELLPVGVVVRALSGARLVYDVHENVREQIHNKHWIPPWLRPTIVRAYDFVENLCLREVDHVILAADSIRHCYSGDVVTVVRNFPILDVGSWNASLRSYSNRPILGYCGFVTEIRGALEMVEVLAHLVRRCPDAEMRLVGPCVPESLEGRLRERARTLGIGARLHLYGRLPLDQAMTVMRECDLGLALVHPEPNYRDLMPTKMFEYMSLGMPVVISDFPVPRGIVESADCGLAVDPFDTESIAMKIAALNGDPRRVREMGENGRRAVHERYCWAAEARALLQVYDDLEHRGNGPSTGSDARPRRAFRANPASIRASVEEPIGAGCDR